MAVTIQASACLISGFTAPTARPNQNHIVYAQNQGAWWIFYLTSTDTLSAIYSTNNGASWNTPGGSSFNLVFGHNGNNINFGFAYANISSDDVLHMSSSYGNVGLYHSRFTLGTTWTNTNGEVEIDANPYRYCGNTTGLDSSGYVYDNFNNSGVNSYIYYGSSIDSGASWVSGFIGDYVYDFCNNIAESTAIIPMGTSVLGLADNGSGTTSFDNLNYTIANASGGSYLGTVFASNITPTDYNAWGACGRTLSDAHVVALSDNSSNYIHYRFNGSTWSVGDTIGSLAYGTNSGISLASDGTSVWAYVIDSSSNVQYNKWISGTGWLGWTIQEASRTNTPSNIISGYNPTAKKFLIAWSEANSPNYDIIGSVLSLAVAYNLPSGEGSFSETGEISTLSSQRNLLESPGVFVETGVNINLHYYGVPNDNMISFYTFVGDLGTKVHNLNSDTLKVALTDTAPVTTNTIFSNISEIGVGNGYTSGGATVPVSNYSQTSGLASLNVSNTTFTASGGTIGPFRYAVLYNSTSDTLIGYYDYRNEVILNSGDIFSMAWSSNEILTVQ